MSLDKLTAKFQMALTEAQSLAVRGECNFIEPEHVMKAMLDQSGGSIGSLLTKAKVNTIVLKQQISEAIKRFPKVSGTQGEIHISNSLNRLLNITDKLAQEHKDIYISSEFFVLAAMIENCSLQRLLKQAGAELNLVKQAISDIRGGETVQDQAAEDQREALNKYTLDLLEKR